MVVTRSGKKTSLDASGSTCITSTTEAAVTDTVPNSSGSTRCITSTTEAAVTDTVSNSATFSCTVSDRSGTVATRCPFCSECFQRLGNHLRHCKQRGDADYSTFLSEKTRGKVKAVRKACPNCGRRFMRLDTHLRSCIRVETTSPPVQSTSIPVDVCSIDNHEYHGKVQLTNTLILPSSSEEWAEADAHFTSSIIPSIANIEDPNELNSLLCEQVYKYFSERFGVRKSRPNSKVVKPRHAKHNRALKEVHALKVNARKEMKVAKRNGVEPSVIRQLARSFYDLLHRHNQLKRKSEVSNMVKKAVKLREKCHANVWKFAKDLFNDNLSTSITPGFNENTAYSFFRNLYRSNKRPFEKPDWLPTPAPPAVEFDGDEIRMDEIITVVKRSSARSTPSPCDNISYRIFKKCPTLLGVLHKLFNKCWSMCIIPDAWKTAVIKLLGKMGAEENPTNPACFRPIALTSCVGKLFTSILRNRWLSFMCDNGYFNRSIQKAFMPGTSGCIEHQFKLGSIITDARRNHRSLAICWLDLANAYGSVNHSLIQFALQHYHAPSQFCRIVGNLYDGLLASIVTTDWTTPLIPLGVGVYQGDPLSVVVFNTVINTLIDTIKPANDLGYTISNSSHSVNLLQYADDTCIVAKSKSCCQMLLNMVDRWLRWSGMAPKVSKCHSLAIQASTAQLVDPCVSLWGEPVPFTGSQPVRFLGKQIMLTNSQSQSSAKANLMGYVKQLLQKLDGCLVTDKQKTVLYKVGVCPRLSWLLMLEELPISWITSTVEVMATKYLKKWTGLAASANTSLLYLSRKKGGLNLPALSTIFKKVQVSRAAQLLQADDLCVRFLAERKLQADVGLKRRKFLPTVVVRDCMIEDPGRSRQLLMKYVKHEVERVDDETRGDELVHLERQGQMMKEIYSSPSAAEIWATAVESLPPRISRFALNAAVDTLPHGANLHMWRKKTDDKCPLCGERQSLIHVLNACPRALQLRRYNERHDQILKILAGMIRKSLPSDYHSIVDLGDESYAFPCHIVSTDVRPDMVWWSDKNKKICFMELTVCFETSFIAAATRKQLRYAELVENTKKAGHVVKLITVEVGSRGGIMTGVLKPLVDELKWSSRLVRSLMTDIGRIAIAESYKVWCSRNYEAIINSDSS